MFEADTRTRYFYARAGQCQRADNMLHVALILFSGTTFLSLLDAIPWASGPWVPLATASLVTLLSISASVFKLGVQAAAHATAAAEMGRVFNDLKVLWGDYENHGLSDDEATARLSALKERSMAASRPVSTSAVQRRLLKSCYNDAERMTAAHA